MFINQLSNQEIINFISSVLSSEYAVFNSSEPKFRDFSSYLQISSKDDNEIVISSNFNCGLVSYNIFTLTDFGFKALYPLCQDVKNYEQAWQNYISNRFPTYQHELKKFLVRQGKNK